MQPLHSNISKLPVSDIPECLKKNGSPVNIILDTDMGNDVDDALALAMLHTLQTRGACKLLAVTLTNPEPLAGPCVAAINTFYKRPHIPVGISPKSPFVRPSAFLKMADLKNPDGSPAHPQNFDISKAPTALQLLRKTLADSPDNSVVIAQIGFFTNNAALLASPPDDISPLPGIDLIRQKVRFLSVMAGSFGTVQSNNHWLEFNVVYDIPSAKSLAASWPTPILWGGAEVGDAVPFPAASIDHDLAYVPQHPIKNSYQLFRATPHERPTWDPITALAAIYPDRSDYFTTSIQGSVQVLDDGFTRFHPAKGDRDRYLIITPQQAAALRALFSALVCQPPQ